MAKIETSLTMAERHVRENERRISGQKSRAIQLQIDGHDYAAANARSLLLVFEETQRLALEHLQYERESGH